MHCLNWYNLLNFPFFSLNAPLVLLALSSWLEHDHTTFIAFSGMAIIVFRAELCVILGPLLLIRLIERRISVVRVILLCALFGPIILGETIQDSTLHSIFPCV